MTERKCGRCRKPGHNVTTCTADMYATDARRSELIEAELAVLAEVGPTPEQQAEMNRRRDLGAAGALVAPTRSPQDDKPKPWWHGALVSGVIACGHRVEEGDMVRSLPTGINDLECHAYCGQLDPTPTFWVTGAATDVSPEVIAVMDPGPAWERPTAANVQMPDAFSSEERERTGRSGGLTPEPDALPPGATDAERNAWLMNHPASNHPITFSAPEPIGLSPDERSAVDDFLSVANAPAKVGGSAEQSAIDSFLSGQVPEQGEARVKTERLGYRIKLPTTGEFQFYKNGKIKGVTRTTTFVKAASDSTGITNWNKRNVLLGAARRPELVAQAYGKDVSDDKTLLDSLVEQLEDSGGGNRASAEGTLVHKYTERLDAGEIKLADVPPAYRGTLTAYVDELEQHELEVVPHLIERTVYMPHYGGVVGTFDRVLYHRPSKTYVMADVKTGKDLTYGWDEIQAQEWVYAEGYNSGGTYVWADWEEDLEQERWEAPEFEIRTDVGVVMWLPLVGPHAGTCQLLMTDLEAGHRYAQLCATVRESRSHKSKPVPWVAPARAWEAEFSAVTDPAQANALWQEAVDSDDCRGGRLKLCVGLAKLALERQHDRA